MERSDDDLGERSRIARAKVLWREGTGRILREEKTTVPGAQMARERSARCHWEGEGLTRWPRQETRALP